MKIGIIGFGRRGEYFLKKSLKDKLDVCIYSEHLSSKDKPKNVILCTTLQDLIEEKPDVVIISSSDKTHFKYAQEIIKAHIPLLIEKPSTISHQNTEVLSKLTKQYNTPVFVAYNHRGSNLYIEAKKFLSQHSNILSIHCNIFSNIFNTLTQTDDLFFNVASHYIDCLNELLDFPKLDVLSSVILQQQGKDMAGNVSLLMNENIPLNISFNFSAKCFPELCESCIYFYTKNTVAILSRNSLKIISDDLKIKEYLDDSEKFFTDFCSSMQIHENKKWCTLQEDLKNLQVLEDIIAKTLFIKKREELNAI